MQQTMHVQKSEQALLVEHGTKRHRLRIRGAGWRAVRVRAWLCCNKGIQAEQLGPFKGLWTVSTSTPPQRLQPVGLNLLVFLLFLVFFSRIRFSSQGKVWRCSIGPPLILWSKQAR